MFNSGILDVGIGLLLLFLLTSLLATALQEAVETLLKKRSANLHEGIESLLGSVLPAGGDAAERRSLLERFYTHPKIAALMNGPYRGDGRADRRSLPSYIPPANFTAAFLDVCLRTPSPEAAGAPDPAAAPLRGVLSMDALREASTKIKSEPLRQIVTAALDDAGQDIGAFKASIDAWFDSSMDRVSGWYKRHTQKWLFIYGFVGAVIFNIDPIVIGQRLAQDETLRRAFIQIASDLVSTNAAGQSVQAAGLEAMQEAAPATPAPTTPTEGTEPESVPAVAEATDAPAGEDEPPAEPAATEAAAAPGGADAASDIGMLHELETQLAAIEAPIGWSPPPQVVPGDWLGWVVLVILTLLGWGMTGLATMLGAPFWFDVLNKFMVVRSTVKPNEKSPPEGSEDRSSGTEHTVKIVGATGG